MPKLRNSCGRLAVVLAIPLLFLAFDLYRFPLLFSKYTPFAPVSVTELVAHGTYPVGNYRGHRIYASIDDIAEPGYLAFLSKQTTGLLISAYERDPKHLVGALQGATLARLQSLAPSDAIQLVDAASTASASCGGTVSDVPLHIPPNERSQFAVDHVFVALLPEGHPDAKNVGAEIRSAILCWQQDGLDSLVVPPLTVRLDGRRGQTLSLGDFYQTFFTAVPDAERPNRLYLSLYRAWPTRELEAATSALNVAWRKQVSDETGDYVVNRQEIRLPLIALVLCLFVCAFYVRYTPRALLTIAVAFMALGFGANEWITPLAAGGNGVHRLELTAVVLLIMAVMFPAIVSWNPKDVLGKRKRS